MSGPRGEQSSVTSAASRPVSALAYRPGWLTVADESMYTGAAGPAAGRAALGRAWHALTRCSRRTIWAMCEPKTPP